MGDVKGGWDDVFIECEIWVDFLKFGYGFFVVGYGSFGEFVYLFFVFLCINSYFVMEWLFFVVCVVGSGRSGNGVVEDFVWEVVFFGWFLVIVWVVVVIWFVCFLGDVGCYGYGGDWWLEMGWEEGVVL